MKASIDIKEFIKNEEGLRLTSYDDGQGNLTIGYGHEISSSAHPMKMDVIAANALFEDDILEYEQVVNDAIPIALKQNEFDALVSFAFNLGALQFKISSVVKYMNAHAPYIAANYLMQYCHGNHEVLVGGLLSRRLKETMILLGIEEVGYVHSNQS